MINSGLLNSHLINAAAGPDALEDVLETAVITSSMVASNSGPWDDLETAVITNPEPTLVVVSDVTETAVITNPEPVQILSDNITESAVLNDTVSPSGSTYEDVAETAIVTDNVALSAVVVDIVSEAAVITSNVVQPTPTADVTDTAVITSSVTHSTSGVLDVLETAVITSNVSTGQYEEVTDSAVITSAVSIDATGTLDVTESAVITGNVVLESTNILDITEAAVISSTVTQRADVVTDITEEGFISSEVYISAHADVWTANTINWAMSTHTGLTMTSSAGDYAVSEDGLFSKADTYADLNMSTGRSSLGVDVLKSMPYSYVYAEHRAPMEIRVTADVDGVEHTEEYQQMARDSSDTRAIRCTFGKGFRSSYYKLHFTSSGYAQVRTCVPVVSDLGRRI